MQQNLATTDDQVPVYLSNYRQAQSDTTMMDYVKLGGFGKFYKEENIVEIQSPNQYQIVRMNRDTLYAESIFNLTTSVTLTMPPTNGYYMSLQIIDEDNYILGVIYPERQAQKTVKIIYNPDPNKKSTNQTIYSTTKYVFCLTRTLVNPSNQTDLARARALQNNLRVQQATKGEFVIQNWNLDQMNEIRNSVSSLIVYVQPGAAVNGYRGKIDPTYQLIGTAAGWGGLPPQDAVYQAFFPQNNVDDLVYYIYVAPDSVPIYPIGFWSLTVYNATSYLQYNQWNSYSLNSLTAKPETNGSYVLYFSSIGKKQDYMTNWIWTYPGWNYLARLYTPKEQIIDLSWQFPPLIQLN